MKSAADHLWMHFTRMAAYVDAPVPTIAKGDGAYIWDTNGKRYLDGLSGLFVVQVGHGRRELAQAAAKQAEELACFPIWSYAHPRAVELAERLAHLAPGDLNRVFFTTGGESGGLRTYRRRVRMERTVSSRAMPISVARRTPNLRRFPSHCWSSRHHHRLRRAPW